MVASADKQTTLSNGDATQAQDDVDKAQAESTKQLTDAQDKATTNADKIIASINQNIAGIDEDIRQLQQLVTDNPNDTEIADKLADAQQQFWQQQLADANSSLSDAEAQKDAIANAETLADITDINNALSHDDASAGVDKETAQDLADARQRLPRIWPQQKSKI